mmetsp:Transcript_15438/g.20382  ORF Transcript_15438/g.20382 Transcript_15438/m.20382 type:complete len:365 (-) Transcript_15438:325-1419(-)
MASNVESTIDMSLDDLIKARQKKGGAQAKGKQAGKKGGKPAQKKPVNKPGNKLTARKNQNQNKGPNNQRKGIKGAGKTGMQKKGIAGRAQAKAQLNKTKRSTQLSLNRGLLTGRGPTVAKTAGGPKQIKRNQANQKQNTGKQIQNRNQNNRNQNNRIQNNRNQNNRNQNNRNQNNRVQVQRYQQQNRNPKGQNLKRFQQARQAGNVGQNKVFSKQQRNYPQVQRNNTKRNTFNVQKNTPARQPVARRANPVKVQVNRNPGRQAMRNQPGNRRNNNNAMRGQMQVSVPNQRQRGGRVNIPAPYGAQPALEPGQKFILPQGTEMKISFQNPAAMMQEQMIPSRQPLRFGSGGGPNRMMPGRGMGLM